MQESAYSKAHSHTTHPGPTLDHPQFQAAVSAAKDRFGRIRAKYPQLKGYLVLSIPGRQTGIGGSPQDILGALPAIVVDDDAKSALRQLLDKPPSKDASEADKKRWSDQTRKLSTLLRYHGDCRVEIRFDQLDYELIRQLQSDEMVDRELTPRTRASIRIVLGTLSDLIE